MSERLEVNVFDTYEGCSLVCSIAAYNDKKLLHSWTTDDPEGVVRQGIHSTRDSTFDKVRMEQHLKKVFELFEPKKITVEGR